MDVRKLKTNLAIIIILLVIVGGYAFFLLSPRLFSLDESRLLFTPIAQEVSIDTEHTVSVEEWQYSKNEHKMSVILSLKSTASNPSEKYVYQVMSRNKVKDKTAINYDVTYQSPTFATIIIEGVPDDFAEIAISVGFINKNIDEETSTESKATYSTVFTNKNKVETVENIERFSVVEIYIDKINKENNQLRDEIKQLKDENDSLESQKTNILETVADLRKSESYLTDAETENVHSQIASYQKTYDDCQKKIDANSATITEKTALLSGNTKKISELKRINVGE